jgi:hypothetical protein
MLFPEFEQAVPALIAIAAIHKPPNGSIFMAQFMSNLK